MSILRRFSSVRFPSLRPEPLYLKESLKEVLVCLGPNAEKSAAALKSACELAARSEGFAAVKGIHVAKSENWRSDPRVQKILREAKSVSVDVKVVEDNWRSRSTLLHEVSGQDVDDLVVVGPETRWIFPTVQYVLKYAPCDVLVARNPELLSGSIKAVVCFGINDWEGSLEAFKAVLRLCKPGDRIEAVHVIHANVDPLFGPPMIPPAGDASVVEKIRDSLASAMKEVVADVDIKLTPTVIQAGFESPTKVLVDYATNCGADLVAVGAGSLKQWGQYLSKTSPCSVLVARRTHHDTTEKPTYLVPDPQEWVKRKSFI